MPTRSTPSPWAGSRAAKSKKGPILAERHPGEVRNRPSRCHVPDAGARRLANSRSLVVIRPGPGLSLKSSHANEPHIATAPNTHAHFLRILRLYQGRATCAKGALVGF